jgi:hypothetical protein
MIKVSTADEFNAFLALSRAGESAVYYCGFLACEKKHFAVRELADAVAKASRDGQASLTQRRIAKDLYEYRVTRR